MVFLAFNFVETLATLHLGSSSSCQQPGQFFLLWLLPMHCDMQYVTWSILVRKLGFIQPDIISRFLQPRPQLYRWIYLHLISPNKTATLLMKSEHRVSYNHVWGFQIVASIDKRWENETLNWSVERTTQCCDKGFVDDNDGGAEWRLKVRRTVVIRTSSATVTMVPNEVAKSTVTVRRKRKRKNIVGGGEEQRSMTVRRGTK